jgi:hypothetical protein
MNKFIEDELNLHRPASRGNRYGGPRLGNTQRIKTHLLQEIVELESQLERAQGANPVDLSLIQTYAEMLHSRKLFFNQLERGG